MKRIHISAQLGVDENGQTWLGWTTFEGVSGWYQASPESLEAAAEILREIAVSAVPVGLYAEVAGMILDLNSVAVLYELFRDAGFAASTGLRETVDGGIREAESGDWAVLGTYSINTFTEDEAAVSWIYRSAVEENLVTENAA